MVLLLQYTIIFASVLCLVALGGCFSEHSGVINLGLEGIMVMGALGGAVTMFLLPAGTAKIVIVLATTLFAVLVGMLYSCLLGVACINFKADQTLIGTAMNLLATAAATVFVRALNTSINPDNVSSSIQYIQEKKAFLKYFGKFEFNWFMVMAVVLLVASWFLLYKTKFGLRLMACGENPQAADSVGINVYKMRWAGVLISGFLGGLHPIGTIFASFFIQSITDGGALINKSVYPSQISDLISSIIIYLCGFVLFFKFVINNWISKKDKGGPNVNDVPIKDDPAKAEGGEK